MSSDLANIQSLVKALEAGQYNAAPSSLVQGSALQIEDLSPVMSANPVQNVVLYGTHQPCTPVRKVYTTF